MERRNTSELASATTLSQLGSALDAACQEHLLAARAATSAASATHATSAPLATAAAAAAAVSMSAVTIAVAAASRAAVASGAHYSGSGRRNAQSRMGQRRTE